MDYQVCGEGNEKQVTWIRESRDPDPSLGDIVAAALKEFSNVPFSQLKTWARGNSSQWYTTLKIQK